MPEGLEAEIWKRAASVLARRTVRRVWCDDRVAPPHLADRLIGCRIVRVRRAGKVVLVDTDGPTLGLHFGMTGRLVVDGDAPIAHLAYASRADREQWDRLRLHTGPGVAPALRLNDPRRLGRVTLDPDLDHLGPDALSLTSVQVERAFERRTMAVKALVLDQSVISGLGNLCADEILFWCGVDPHRPAEDLTAHECATFAQQCRERLATMLAAGGSTTGLLGPPMRKHVAPCPLDGTDLRRDRIGGRTSIWCPRHQV
jgi:formamidopyrimidine-DNA glycosylase